MTASLFTITPTPPTSLKLTPGQDGRFSFTVTSLAAPDKTHEVMLQALLVGDDGKGKEADWLVAGPQRTFTMTGGKTETVAITARPTATTPRREHRVKLVVADRDRPNDVFQDSSPVTCEVTAAPDSKPPPTGRPGWLIPVIIAGAVVLLGGGGLLVWKLTSDKPGLPTVGETCGSDTAHPCDEGLVCMPGVNKCLLASGRDCKPAQADQCASGDCTTTEICAIPIGAACSPADKDLVPCRQNTACDPVTKTCLGHVGAACTRGTDCETGECSPDHVCAVKAPAVKAGDPCETSCPSPLQCSLTTKRCVAQLGTVCNNNNQCITGLCEAGVCAAATAGRNCTADGICGADQKCLEVQPGLKRCGWNPGHSCTSNAECTSQWCNAGACSRDDGKCDAPTECPSPYVCIQAKQRCLLPISAVCGGHAQCDSTYCNPSNRCAPPPCNPACSALFHCNNDPAAPKCIRNILIPIDITIKQRPPWTIPLGVH